MMIILMVFVMTKLMEIELVITNLARHDDNLDSYDYNVVADDNSTNETNDDGLI